MEKINKYYAHGKLLLSGEYFVLDGAQALAIPTRFGQSLEVTGASSGDGTLFWESLDENGNSVLSIEFKLGDFKILNKKGEVPHYLLQDSLWAARSLNPGFLKQEESVRAVSQLEFSMGWGLGSSSTLVHNIATWAQVAPFDLFFKVLQGSGYDIACANANKPIVYQLKNNHAVWNEINFNPSFTDRIFFAYLGKKQNSQQAIRQYRDREHHPEVIEQINHITGRMIASTAIEDFIALMKAHESILSSALRLEKVQDMLFNDFPGAVKSLGAWGGDFVMALSKEKPEAIAGYFHKKGYTTLFPFRDILFEPDSTQNKIQI